MAQDRRLNGQNRVAGDPSHNDFWGRESVLEVCVGGACLPEALQRRKMPRVPDTPDVTGAMDADIPCPM